MKDLLVAFDNCDSDNHSFVLLIFNYLPDVSFSQKDPQYGGTYVL